jgi:hypothetical protein
MRWSEGGFNHVLHLRLGWVNGRFEASPTLVLSPNQCMHSLCATTLLLVKDYINISAAPLLLCSLFPTVYKHFILQKIYLLLPFLFRCVVYEFTYTLKTRYIVHSI